MTHTPDHPVFIKDCECLTPFGGSEETRAALEQGAIALKPTRIDDIRGEPELPLALLSPLGKALPPRWLEPCRRIVSNLRQRPWGDARHPVIISSSNFGIEQLLAHFRQPTPTLARVATPARAVEAIAGACGFGTNCCIVSNACVSAQLALLEAEALVRGDRADEALVLSFDCLSSFVIGGFAALKILNGQQPRPYQKGDSGAIGLGEGVAVAVVSRQQSDIQLVGTVCHQESYHMTANDPSGQGFKAVAGRLRELTGTQRFWLKGHGTGTLDAGRLEAETFADSFPDSPLVSWKGSLGHTLGSCGLVEMAIAIAALRRGRAPGNVATSGPYFATTISPEPFETTPFDGVSLLSSAFGGAHAATYIRYA